MKVLKERGARYGSFSENAKDAKAIRDRLLSGVDDPVIFEGVDYLIKKLVRVKGDPYYIDTFRDIAGYAQLIVKYLEEESEEARDARVVLMEKDASGNLNPI